MLLLLYIRNLLRLNVTLLDYGLLDHRLLDNLWLKLRSLLSSGDNGWGVDRLLDHRLVDSWMGNNLLSLSWEIFNVLFDSLLWNHINFNFLSGLWNIFSNVFNLLIVCIFSLNWDWSGLSNSLIFSDSSCNWNIFNSLLSYLFSNLSFIRDLDVIYLLFIIGISFGDGDTFDIWLILRLRLLENLGSWCQRLLWLNNRLS